MLKFALMELQLLLIFICENGSVFQYTATAAFNFTASAYPHDLKEVGEFYFLIAADFMPCWRRMDEVVINNHKRILWDCCFVFDEILTTLDNKQFIWKKNQYLSIESFVNTYNCLLVINVSKSHVYCRGSCTKILGAIGNKQYLYNEIYSGSW